MQGENLAPKIYDYVLYYIIFGAWNISQSNLQQKNRLAIGFFELSSLVATTYSRVHHTTIGLGVFHFRVRNGIGWDNTSIIATTELNLWFNVQSIKPEH